MTVEPYMLVVPDERGGMGMDRVGAVLVWGDERPSWRPWRVVQACWLMDPNKDRWRDGNYSPSPGHMGVHGVFVDENEAGVTMSGAFPSLRALADWTGYAVAEIDGTLVYQPEGVFRYARRDPDGIFREAF